MVFRLNLLCRVWPKGNSSSTIFNKVIPMFVATFLKGGLYQMMFLLRLRLVVFVVVLRGCLNLS